MAEMMKKLPTGEFAAKSGSLEMVKVVEQYTPLIQRGVANAASSGSVEVLQYYLDKGFHLDDERICENAALWGHYNLLRFAVSRGAKLSTVLGRSQQLDNCSRDASSWV